MARKELKVVITGDPSGARRAIAQVHDDSSKLGTIFGAVGRAAVTGFKAVTVAAGSAVGIGVKVAGDLQQAQIGFTTMLGSAEKAQSFLKGLADFAAKTPFELPGLIDSSRALLAMGFNAQQVMPIMRSVGDAVAAVGGGQEMIERVTRALGQMNAKGKVSAEEMRQLAEAGIPAWEFLAKKLKVDIPTAMKMVEKRAVDSSTFVSAFMENTAAKFGGAMEKQSQTLFGLFSTLKDTVRLKLADIASPLVEGITASLPQITTAVDSFLGQVGPAFAGFIGQIINLFTSLLPVVQPILTVLANEFGYVLAAVVPVLQQLAPFIAHAAQGIALWINNLTSLLPVLGQLLVALGPLLPSLAGLGIAILNALTPALIPLIEKLTDLAVALIGTNEKAGPLLIVITQLATAIAALPPGLIQLAIGAYAVGKAFTVAKLSVEAFKVGMALGNLDKFAGLAGVLGNLGALFARLAPLGGLVMRLFSGIGAVARMAALGFQALAAALGISVGWLIAIVAAVVIAAVLIVKNWDTIKKAVGAAWDFIVDKAKAAWSAIQSVVGAFVGFITQVPGKIAAALSAVPGIVMGFVSSVASGIVSLGASVLSGFVSFLAQLPTAIAYWLGFAIGSFLRGIYDIVRLVVEWGPKLIESFVSFVSQLPGKAWDALVGVYNFVVDRLGAALSFTLDFGGKLVTGFVSFVSQLPGRAAEFFSAVWRNVTSWLSQTVSAAIQKGSELLSAFVDFASKIPGRVADFVGQLPGKIADAVSGMVNEARRIGDQLVGIFEDVAKKIVRAVADLPGKLLGMAKNIGSSFVNGLKDGLGIHSPSLPEKYFTNIRNSAVMSSKAVQGAVANMGKVLVNSDLPAIQMAGAGLRSQPQLVSGASTPAQGAGSPLSVSFADGAITVQAAPGQDAEEIAAEVLRQVEEKVMRKLAQRMRAG